MQSRPRVELSRVVKRFGGVHAVRDVTLGFAAGSIIGLVGENGAGKSTIGKMLAGVHRPDSGEILLNGKPVRFSAPRDALRAGIGVITQELSNVPGRSALENVFLGIETNTASVVRTAPLRKRFNELLELTGFEIDPDVRVGHLRIAEQIRIEIMRALARDVDVLVMDEVTAALTFDESERLFEIVRMLRARGTTVVYISHFLQEVLNLVDDVVVMRNGELVKQGPAKHETTDSLVAAMVGRAVDVVFPPKRLVETTAPVVASFGGVSRIGAVDDVSLIVRRGEIVGMAGLVGSGRTEFARAVFGADPHQIAHSEINGRPWRVRSPRDAIRAGMAMVPESRKDDGLVFQRSVLENIALPHLATVSRGGVILRRAETARVEQLVERLDIRTASLNAPVGTLSGGNQQKVLFARWLFKSPEFLIADEPTRGVDIGAKLQIYRLLVSLAADGLGILLISSELEEVMGLSHRLLVMREGRLVAEYGRDVDEETVMRAAFGGSDAA